MSKDYKVGVDLGTSKSSTIITTYVNEDGEIKISSQEFIDDSIQDRE